MSDTEEVVDYGAELSRRRQQAANLRDQLRGQEQAPASEPVEPPLQPVASSDGTEGRNWKRLAKAVRVRRDELCLTQAQAAERAHISPEVWSRIERAARDNYQTSSLARVAGVLGWTTASISQVLADGEPTSAGDEVPRAPLEEIIELLRSIDVNLFLLVDHLGANRRRPVPDGPAGPGMRGLS